MQFRHLAALGIALAASGAALAQTVVLPIGAAAAEGPSNNTFPWGRNAGAIRIQTIYDSSHFTGQSIGFPIRITGARYRANGSTSTWTGTTYNGVEFYCSTAAVDQAAANATWTVNRGGDYTQVYNGAVAFIPGTGNGTTVPGPTVVDVTFTTPFLYDPTSGNDFLTEVTFPANSWTGGGTTSCDVFTTGSNCSRVFNSTDPTAVTGTVGLNHALVVELVYQPAAGLFADFTATPTSGPSPLTVNFTDTTFTSDPAGVQTWAWDLNGDTIVDSNAQNPSYTYGACGPYNVSLTVTDTQNPSSTKTKNGFIFADPQLVVDANFTAAPAAGVAPLNVSFTDTSTGNPTTWAWDLDGDTIIDSNAQNPAFTYSVGGQYTVTLTSSNACFSSTETKVAFINVAGSGANLPADKLCYQFNELRGGTAANVATGSAFPARGTVSTTTWQGAPGAGRGRFDANEPNAGSLRYLSSARVNTGAPMVHSGSLTIMWWFRRDPSTAASTTTSYAFGDGTFRAFHGGVAGTGIWFRGTSLGDLQLNQNIVATPGWQHLALVINDAAGRWDWYLNGAPASNGAFTANTFAYNGTTPFGVGAISGTGTSYYTLQNDMDDFRMYSSALGFGDVIAAMGGETASNGAYDAGCAGPTGVPVLSASQRPILPNPTYSLDLSNAEPGRPAALIIGTQTSLGGILPLDLSGLLGAGCALTVFPEIQFPIFTGAGAVNIPLPLPADPSVNGGNGFHGYTQIIVLGTAGATTNSLDVSLQID
ncbi:MAG: PKD domain-containing protein [Planctomycetes bacterium]|nr:PKD domain-containing protein [Planctomycetota bacterium]